MEFEIELNLPQKGLLLRDLVVSSLLYLGQDGKISIEGDKIKIKVNSEGVMLDRINELKNYLTKDNLIMNSLKSFSKNYKNAYKLLTEDIKSEDFAKTILEDLKKSDEEDYSYPSLIPEFLESGRWYGGWKGSSGKTKLDISKSFSFLGTVSFSLFRLGQYIEKGNKKVLMLCPVDSTVQLMEVTGPKILYGDNLRINEIKDSALAKLSHNARLFLASLKINEGYYQKLTVVHVDSHRAEILEDNNYSSISSLIQLSSALNKKDEFIKMLSPSSISKLKDSNCDYNCAESKAVNTFLEVSNLILEGLKGSISPDEFYNLVSRDSFIKDPSLAKILNPYRVRELKRGLETVLTVKNQLTY
ncbi:hypothetical protein [Acidianus manzaensis]|uniref:CRISPR-associated protein n=1 Tax=Acidianus manzaensis TaxID=282676 RepID=A0A1W6JWF6_9CREN|nr:hypothetical protein [Acidianus manzaensis]ARM74579.1 hypothetical protein B6F84_00070 [Acidianus manzaensis]